MPETEKQKTKLALHLVSMCRPRHPSRRIEMVKNCRTHELIKSPHHCHLNASGLKPWQELSSKGIVSPPVSVTSLNSTKAAKIYISLRRAVNDLREPCFSK